MERPQHKNFYPKDFINGKFEDEQEKYIDYLEAKFKIGVLADVSISVDRANNYGRQQFNRGVMDLDLVKFEDWQH